MTPYEKQLVARVAALEFLLVETTALLFMRSFDRQGQDELLREIYTMSRHTKVSGAVGPEAQTLVDELVASTHDEIDSLIDRVLRKLRSETDTPGEE